MFFLIFEFELYYYIFYLCLFEVGVGSFFFSVICFIY